MADQCLSRVLPLVEEPPLPYLPRNSACHVSTQDLDVTAPDPELVSNAIAAKELSVSLAR